MTLKLPNPFMPASAGLPSRFPAVGQASPRQQTARGRGEVLARFVLDEEKFMEAIEPPPLFLQWHIPPNVVGTFWQGRFPIKWGW